MCTNGQDEEKRMKIISKEKSFSCNAKAHLFSKRKRKNVFLYILPRRDLPEILFMFIQKKFKLNQLKVQQLLPFLVSLSIISSFSFCTKEKEKGKFFFITLQLDVFRWMNESPSGSFSCLFSWGSCQIRRICYHLSIL